MNHFYNLTHIRALYDYESEGSRLIQQGRRKQQDFDFSDPFELPKPTSTKKIQENDKIQKVDKTQDTSKNIYDNEQIENQFKKCLLARYNRLLQKSLYTWIDRSKLRFTISCNNRKNFSSDIFQNEKEINLDFPRKRIAIKYFPESSGINKVSFTEK